MAVGRVKVVLVIRIDQLLVADLAGVGTFLGGGMLGKLQALTAAAAHLPVAGAVAIPVPQAVGRLAGKSAGGAIGVAIVLKIMLLHIPDH